MDDGSPKIGPIPRPLYNRPDFISADPIGLVHAFEDPRDREIVGFWVAMLAWGRRQTIINKSTELIELMEGRPHQFIVNHAEEDRNRFADWKHRTFNFEDTRYFSSLVTMVLR